jgi:hypothetical protein
MNPAGSAEVILEQKKHRQIGDVLVLRLMLAIQRPAFAFFPFNGSRSATSLRALI